MNLMAINQATTLTMSSREIAELTGKRHDHVMRDIKAMLDSLGGVPSFGDTYRNEQNGQEYPIFRLDKEHTLCLVSGYNVKMRMAIIQRWQVLEEQKHTTGYDVAMRHRVMKRWRELEEKEAGAPLSTVDLLRMAAAKIEAQWCAAGSLYPVRFARANNFCQPLLLLPE